MNIDWGVVQTKKESEITPYGLSRTEKPPEDYGTEWFRFKLLGNGVVNVLTVRLVVDSSKQPGDSIISTEVRTWSIEESELT